MQEYLTIKDLISIVIIKSAFYKIEIFLNNRLNLICFDK
jgi:hypothetical protein